MQKGLLWTIALVSVAALTVIALRSSFRTKSAARAVAAENRGAQPSQAGVRAKAGPASALPAPAAVGVPGRGRGELIWTGNAITTGKRPENLILSKEGRTTSFDPRIDSSDFDGDGKADLLWRDTVSGAVASWTSSGRFIRLGTESDGWTVAH